MAPINTYRRRMAVPIGSRATSGHYSVLRRRGQAATGRLNVRITRGQAPDTAGPDTDDSVSEPAGAGDDQLDAADAGQLERGDEGADAHGIYERHVLHVEFDAAGARPGELAGHRLADLVR